MFIRDVQKSSVIDLSNEPKSHPGTPSPPCRWAHRLDPEQSESVSQSPVHLGHFPVESVLHGLPVY